MKAIEVAAEWAGSLFKAFWEALRKIPRGWGKVCAVGLIIANTVIPATATSFLYISQQKAINGSYIYNMPQLELNHEKYTGTFFGTDCYYLSEINLALVYTAPRGNSLALNHHSIDGAWHFGVEVGGYFATYSIGGVYYIAGNNDGIPEGLDFNNTLQIGTSWE